MANGRPRWEPSPANRAIGLRGADLRDHQGAWMDRGAATTVTDNRTIWSKFLRDALRDDDTGGKARAALRTVLDKLPPPPLDPVDRRKRELVADLIERGRAIIEEREALDPDMRRSPRSVQAMIDGFFADPKAQRKLSANTRSSYRSTSRRLAAAMGARRVDEITSGQILAWHEQMTTRDGLAIGSANVAIGATGAMFQWAMMQDPPWLTTSPTANLRLPSAKGRRVFCTVEEEQTFRSWCDANGFADVADAVTVCLWTGARQVDVCAANLDDLTGTAWRFVPIKTEKKELEALPGILQPVSDRVERRRQEVAQSGVVTLGPVALLWNPETNRRHTSVSIGTRYRKAHKLAIKSGTMREGFEDKRLQDTRDTCITRLFDTDVSLTRITAWTGHAASAAERILRDHYITLRESGAAKDAGKLAEWAKREGLALSA